MIMFKFVLCILYVHGAKVKSTKNNFQKSFLLQVFRFWSTTFRYGVTLYACMRVTRIKRNSVTKSRRSKTKTVLKSVHFQKILELSNSHLVNIHFFFFWSIVLKRVKVKWQCRVFFFKIEHGLFRVIGLDSDQTQLLVSCQLSAIFHSWVAVKDFLVWFHFLLVAAKPSAGSW